MASFQTSPSAKLKGALNFGTFLLIGRLTLGAVFVYYALVKLRLPWMLFAMSVNSYEMLPQWCVALLARTLPWAELFLGLLLLAGWKLRWVAAGVSTLILVFITAMLQAYLRGLKIDCGCGGIGEPLGPKEFLRDGSFLALALAVTIGAFFVRRTRQVAA